MSRDLKLAILFLVVVLVFCVLPILMWTFVFSTFEISEKAEALTIRLYLPFLGFILVTQFIQLMFLRAVKKDEPVSDLFMPWGMGNLWDDPKDYFPPSLARWYRPWRLFFHISGSFFIIGWAVFNVFIL